MQSKCLLAISHSIRLTSTQAFTATFSKFLSLCAAVFTAAIALCNLFNDLRRVEVSTCQWHESHHWVPCIGRKNKAVATGMAPYPLLKTLQIRHRIFSRKPLEYGTVSVALYTTDTEPYPGFKVLSVRYRDFNRKRTEIRYSNRVRVLWMCISFLTWQCC